MIKLGSYYYFSASDVEYIAALNDTSGDYKYRLAVHFKSGKECSVSYTDKHSRDAERDRIAKEIRHEMRSDIEQIHNMVYLLKSSVERIDKRQLRIWRQLKSLLGVNTEEDSDGN